MDNHGILRRRFISRALTLLAASTFALVAGLATVAVPEPEPAAAACRVPWPACAPGGLDPTRTSTLRVDHRETPSGDLVEPDTGETWDIAVHHSPPAPGPCADAITNVTAEVTKTATGWTVTCTGCAHHVQLIIRVRTQAPAPLPEHAAPGRGAGSGRAHGDSERVAHHSTT